MQYAAQKHSARYTGDFTFSQLIPYIGSKRKLLPLIRQALDATGINPAESSFLDAFAGSGVVSRFAKHLGFAVTSNDWEPYAEVLGQCYIALNEAPKFFGQQSYEDVLEELNLLPPEVGWITKHLCPADDVHVNIARDRMFYMRKNGMRLDAVREQIRRWEEAGDLDPSQKSALIAPLLYQGCWLSNTSGVFKGFHNGWGGQTGTALYRIAGDLHLEPAIFHSNSRWNHVTRMDAKVHALEAQQAGLLYDIAYLDPPYNQHPYGSNYHVLNTLTLWDSPPLPEQITGHGNKSAIRMDWRSERRSHYNEKLRAAPAYAELVASLPAHFICTSYSTDGFIPLQKMVEASLMRGQTQVFTQGYKRYRVSSQRFSDKPMNVEFVLLTDTTQSSRQSADSLVHQILQAEEDVLSLHPETSVEEKKQGELFDYGQ